MSTPATTPAFSLWVSPVTRPVVLRRDRLALVFEHGANGVGGGRNRGARADLALHGVEGLQAVTGDDQHRLGVRVELAGFDELLRRRDGDPAGGFGEHALGAGQQPDALDDLLVAHVLDSAAGAP